MKFIKILSVVLVFSILICSFAGCKKETGYPVVIGETEISQPPATVAVLSEQAASAIFALGYKSYLVGAPTEFLNAEISGVTDLGKSMSIDFEKVYNLAPELLIVHGELEESVKANLTARNIKVVMLKTPTKYSEVAPYYEALSKIFLGSIKYTEAYDAYIGETERIITETAASLSGVTKKVVLFVETGFVATGDTIAGEAMKKAGFTNIAENNLAYIMPDADIISSNPDVIFCPPETAGAIMKNESYKDITAIKNAAVYEVDVEALVYASEGFSATLQSMSKYLLQ